MAVLSLKGLVLELLAIERRNPHEDFFTGKSCWNCLWAAPQKDAHAAAKNTPSSLNLRQDMRKLWSDHVIWTRDYIVAAVGGEDQRAGSDRLMKNQQDIGSAVAAYYGKGAGDKLTTLEGAHPHRGRSYQGGKGG